MAFSFSILISSSIGSSSSRLFLDEEEFLLWYDYLSFEIVKKVFYSFYSDLGFFQLIFIEPSSESV
jgi:hypothetical protein